MTLALTAQQGRRVILALQGLAEPPRRALTSAGLEALIERLGFVQIDSIRTVERAHHMILFARNQTYRPELLDTLLVDEGRLFENWSHDAAIIPSRFYPYWQHRFRRDAARLRQRFVAWRKDFDANLLATMLEHVRAHGPVRARDLAPGTAPRERGWWDWHGGKVALEYHWRTGGLAVARREGFQKVYDLSERVIPQRYRDTATSEAEFIAWAAQSALERLGFATPGEIAGFWGLIGTAEAKAWCAAELGRGVCQVEVAGMEAERTRILFARPDIENVLKDLPAPPERIRALNPFDPVLRDRKRLQWLLGFDYRIEIFVPAAKRTYGYYVFPLLEGERMVGRIDMKAERGRDRLLIQGLWLEPGVKLGPGRHRRLEAELERQRRFAGLSAVAYTDGWLKREG